MNKNLNKLINKVWNKLINVWSSEEKRKIVKFSAPLEKCRICCSLKAKWFNTLTEEYSCDECVPRGCSCNLKKKKGRSAFDIQNYEYLLDKQGREMPCEDWKKI